MKEYFYLGSYSEEQRLNNYVVGISYWSINIDTGEIEKENSDIGLKQVTHFSLNNSFLYASNDIFNTNDNCAGGLTVFKRNISLHLEKIQQVSAFGVGTVYTRLVANSCFLLTANYIQGNILVYPIDDTGILGQPIENIQHLGSSVNAERQEAAHPHAIELSHDEKFVYVADLGLDKLKAYQFSHQDGRLTVRKDLDVTVELGSGPRHIRFHSNGQFVYVIHEMSNQISAYRYDNGELSLIKYYDLPTKEEDTTGSELHIHPNGQYLYTSSRGVDCINVYKIDLCNGLLELIQSISTGGSTPTSFAVAPSGRSLVVGNQLSNTITSFVINKVDGKLTLANSKIELEQPIMVGFSY